MRILPENHLNLFARQQLAAETFLLLHYTGVPFHLALILPQTIFEESNRVLFGYGLKVVRLGNGAAIVDEWIENLAVLALRLVTRRRRKHERTQGNEHENAAHGNPSYLRRRGKTGKFYRH